MILFRVLWQVFCDRWSLPTTGGFSQGGSLGLLAALTYPKHLAGILGLNCWLRNMENEVGKLIDLSPF